MTLECVRTLANISRHDSTIKKYIITEKCCQAFAILLQHDNRDIVYYSIGCLLNLSSESSLSHNLFEEFNIKDICSVLFDSSI